MDVSFLRFRSYFSLLQGCRSPEEICSFAGQKGSSRVVMADVNNFYGLIRFLQAARREGVAPVAAVTVERKGRDLFSAYVLERRGFSRICGLLTALLTDSEGEWDPVEDLRDKGWEGLAVLSRRPEVLSRLAGGGSGMRG